MNDRQAFALRNPCYFAFQTTWPAFRYMRGCVSVIVTVNTGYE